MSTNQEKEFLKLLNENAGIIKKTCCLYFENQTERQDLMQEIHLQLWHAYDRFEGRSKASTWVYKVALNTAITFFKKTKKKEKVNDACFEFYEKNELHNDPAQEEQLEKMYKAIEHLSKIEKALVTLYIDDKNYAEMSEILGISEGNARIKMMRIKDKLKKTVNN